MGRPQDRNFRNYQLPVLEICSTWGDPKTAISAITHYQLPITKLYKTGDKVRYLPDGNLEYLGRLDNQVKIRGFRIELEEIEAVLNQHPQIKEASVIPHTDNSGNQRLVAYLVSSHPIENNQIRQFLQQKLPDYMIPSFFVELESLPLTSNGKIDRKSLPIPDLSQQKNIDNTLPATEKEIILTKIWSEVLDRKSVV